MTLYTGDPVILTVTPTDPETSLVIDDAAVTVDLFAPPKRPVLVVADRSVDRGPFELTWDASKRHYSATISSLGFAPGKWWWRATIQREGHPPKHEYAMFRLRP